MTRPLRGLLMISRYAPPMFDVGGKRVARFARQLPDFGWAPLICTSPTPRHRPIDPTPTGWPSEALVDRGLVPRWWPERRGRPSDPTVATPVENAGRADDDAADAQLGSAPIGIPGAGWLGRARTWTDDVRRQIALPVGAEALLAPRTALRLRAILRARGVEAVFATSSPYAMLVHGWMVARAARLPLILDLRDPWSLNFLSKTRAPWIQRSEARIEAALFAAADRVILNCESATAAYAERYPELASKLVTVTNCFEGPVASAPTPPDGFGDGAPEGPLRIVHFGNCYGPRSLRTLLSAIARLRTRAGIDPSSFRIVNLGRVGRRDLDWAQRLELGPILEYRPAVPYLEGLDILRRADLQLLVAYGRETAFLPAKLYDYMRTGAPVLCIAPPSELRRIVDNAGLGLSCDPEEVELCAEHLERALTARRRGESLRRADASVLEPWSARETTRQLVALVEEVVDGWSAHRERVDVSARAKAELLSGESPSLEGSSPARAS